MALWQSSRYWCRQDSLSDCTYGTNDQKRDFAGTKFFLFTFTKKWPLAKILERARRVLGEESALPAIFTFHSLGYTILRKHEDFIGKSLKIAEKVDTIV